MSAVAAAVSDPQLDPSALVHKHTALVRRIAYHLLNRLPPNVQAEDLIQSGMIGLLEASRNYSSTQGASFETYAGIRIRGAMLDEIRRANWAPRSLYRKLRQVSEAMRAVEVEQGRDARDSEVADRLNMPLDEYHQILRDASTQKLFSTEELSSGADVFTESLSKRPDSPLEALEGSEFKRRLAKAIESLPERERLVLALYYDEDLNLREIGDVLGVSESRVCQIHGQAVLRLRGRMKDWRDAH